MTHTHTHDTATHMDWDALGPHLERGGELHAPVAREAVGWLGERLGGQWAAGVRRVVDAGSGPGVFTCLFADAFPAAEVIAVDGTEALLERARARAERLGVADRVRTRVAQLPEGLGAALDTGPADLLWVGNALHHLGDQQRALEQLAAALGPGGVLAVVERGLAGRNLPRDIGFGRPGLQARAEAAAEDWFTEMRAALPDAAETVEDWPGMLAAAGLTRTASRSFLLDRPAPLGPDVRRHVHADLTRQREVVGDRLDAADRAALDRLLDPDDEAGVLRRPDLFLLVAQTVHVGVRAS